MNTEPITSLLSVDEQDLDRRWKRLEAWSRERFGRDPTMESLLFLIGYQSDGARFGRRLSKESKQDLIMEGTCVAMASIGLYGRIDGQWQRMVPFPEMTASEQETLLRVAVLTCLESVADSGHTD